MKRDINLIRELLLQIESKDCRKAEDFDLENNQLQTINYHLILLTEANFIKASFLQSDQSGIEDVIVHRLTWDGHEFLDAARNETAWNNTKKILREKAITVTFDVLKLLLIEGVKAQFGL